MDLDWIMCNVCANEANDPHPLFLTTCRHILCKGCVQGHGVKKQCCLCGNQNIQYMPLDKNCKMPTSIQSLFKRPGDLLKAIYDGVSFQENQKTIYYDTARSKTGAAVSYFENQLKEANRTKKEMENEIMMLRNEIRTLRGKIDHLERSGQRSSNKSLELPPGSAMTPPVRRKANHADNPFTSFLGSPSPFRDRMNERGDVLKSPIFFKK